jgi:hypothetical protein
VRCARALLFWWLPPPSFDFQETFCRILKKENGSDGRARWLHRAVRLRRKKERWCSSSAGESVTHSLWCGAPHVRHSLTSMTVVAREALQELRRRPLEVSACESCCSTSFFFSSHSFCR